jgi:hypothetical protein
MRCLFLFMLLAAAAPLAGQTPPRYHLGYYGDSVRYPGLRLGTERPLATSITVDVFRKIEAQAQGFYILSLSAWRHPRFLGLMPSGELGLRYVFNNGPMIEGLAGLAGTKALETDSAFQASSSLGGFLPGAFYLQFPLSLGTGWQIARKPQSLFFLRITRLPQYHVQAEDWSLGGALQAGFLIGVGRR